MVNPIGEPPQTPFGDLDSYLALPRVGSLVLSPDGSQLVATVSMLSDDETEHVTALWSLDPSGADTARRLTRSAEGETGPVMLYDGSLLFISKRPDPGTPATDDERLLPSLWRLPATGGEAAGIARRPGGISGVVAARHTPTFVVLSDTFPSSREGEDDEAKLTERRVRKVTAILHDSYPVRAWDRDLGPAAPRLFAAQVDGDRSVLLRDLTPDAGTALVDAAYDLDPGGGLVVTTWRVAEPGGVRSTLVAIDVATGTRRTVADDPAADHYRPAISPTGRQVAVIRERRDTPMDPPHRRLQIISLADGTATDLAADWDRWPSALTWTPDGDALIVVADEGGRAPMFRIDIAAEAVVRLTTDDAAYSDPVVSPDGQNVYAVRCSLQAPPSPVRLDAHSPDQPVVTLPSPASTPPLPGRLTEITTTVADGVRLRAWLALPAAASDASPVPLLLWIHGGPLDSWKAWSWRWNPWLMAARGYAVLLPDPALSTGYGQDFIRRGWGRWGDAPYNDLMAITSAAGARTDIDASRTAAMGASFGGYLANWTAAHTDRFDAIVTHAGIWALDQYGSTTDAAWWWEREMTAEMVAANTPHVHADAIATPMLVIHGNKDHRVPIGEAMRLWHDLTVRAKTDDGEVSHRFLYFPDENHWILAPQSTKVWYDTVLAFLDHHVLGTAWRPPTILR